MNTSVLFVLWSIGISSLLYISSVPTTLMSQVISAYSIIIILLFIYERQEIKGTLRLFFIILGSYLTLRYFFWRTFNTLGPRDLLSWSIAILLYAAEVYGMIVHFLGVFVNVSPLNRAPIPLPKDNPESLPSVDILIPSYNEPAGLLEITLIAATQIRYPQHKFNVYLLDDGGTTQKRNDPNPEKATEALHRHWLLRALCLEIGAKYITREKNEHAKAGNINSALPKTTGDLVLILDADHVPTTDILENTVGSFIEDPKLFLVQTPHFFINPDPVEKNLEIFGRIPSENEMFYSVIQHGMDFWNASFFCGSAALLRRKYLNEVGGIAGNTITEDAETALELHSRGYNSAYINIPMVSGLQPESYTAFVIQRVRWSQGMVQIFLLKNPFFKKGLRFWQRFAYLNSCFFWFFSFARMVYLLSPLSYLFLGLMIYAATLPQFAAYALPHIIGTLIVSNHFFGKVRWAFVSELYELMQSIFSFIGIAKVIKNPRSPTFLVTPKGEQLNEDFISKLAKPFYYIYALSILGTLAGIYRLFAVPKMFGVTLITLIWEIFNLIILNAAMGALLERKQRRANPRMPADMDGWLLYADDIIRCRVIDVSVSGALIIVPKENEAHLQDQRPERLFVYNPAIKDFSYFSMKVCNRRPFQKDKIAFGVEFIYANPEQKTNGVLLAHGDSQRWIDFQRSRIKEQGILKSFGFLLKLGTNKVFEHFMLIFKSLDFNPRSVIKYCFSWIPRYIQRFLCWVKDESYEKEVSKNQPHKKES